MYHDVLPDGRHTAPGCDTGGWTNDCVPLLAVVVTSSRNALHELAHRVGFDVVRYPGRWSPLGRRMSLLRTYGINLVLDVGANAGQYAMQLRQARYRGRIVSFEPLPGPLAKLRRRAAKDPLWDVRDLALGDRDGRSTIHIAGNTVSSSLLPMLPEHEVAAPGSKTVGSMEIAVRRLDSLWPDLVQPADVPFLKIDVQGFESHVLEGARDCLPRIAGVQVELSLVRLYEGGSLLLEMVDWLDREGYRLMSAEPGFGLPASGRLMQVDGVFFRDPSVGSIRPGAGLPDQVAVTD